MRKTLISLGGLLLMQSSSLLFASDLGINVILSSEIRPGVYGQVQIGNEPRPPVVYRRPIIIREERQYIHEPPIYLHVPPEHSRHWDKYCRGYNACNRQVYFIKSVEYEPEYQRHHGHDHHHD